ncbi:lipid II:glycine glycyltransferase FemX [Patescibacteria group bacterium]
MEIHQSPLFATFTKNLGWNVIRINETNIFLRKIIFMGTIAKIQRPKTLINPTILVPLLKKHNIKKLVLEATKETSQHDFTHWVNILKKDFSIDTSLYLPTKTSVIDITKSEQTIFNSFSSAKRRAVRRAQKNNLQIQQSTDINELITIKNRSSGLFGFITTSGLKKKWFVFYPSDKATIFLAYTDKKMLLGGIYMSFWDDTAYYWVAGSVKQGKKLFAPTLLIWEAMKEAKKRGYKRFDFVGIWDERLPKQNNNWKGFTKFKEGFGGKPVYYPIHKT